MKTAKRIFIMVTAALLITTGSEIMAAQVKKSVKTVKKVTKNVSQNNQSEAGTAAEKFINGYISGNFDLEKTPTTQKFREEFKNRSEFLELSEKILNEELKRELTEREKNLIEKYRGAEYDAIFGIMIQDIFPGYSKFKVKSYDKKNGIIVLRDSIEPKYAVRACEDSKCAPIYTEISVKVVSQNGKLLIDGAGSVNMK